MSEDWRPNPDDLLKKMRAEEAHKNSAQLRVFLGMSAGVGKTYAMLKAAHQRRHDGRDVVVGLVETHGRSETAALVEGLEIIPRLRVEYKNAFFEELDVDAIIRRKPQIVLIDELAHTNVGGVRHNKRYQDVIEILDAGIDVFTAINVQHLESRKEAVEAITQIVIRETVPDGIIDRANQIELVDIPPTELLKRLREGKVYLGDKAQRAVQNFFKEDRLTALREIALRLTAEKVDQDLQRFTGAAADRKPWQTNERLMVAFSHSPYSERLIRSARRIAYSLEAPWLAAHVDTGTPLSNQDQLQLAKNLNLARELKAEVLTTTDTDVPAALRRIARLKNVTQIIVGRPVKRWLRDRISGGTILDRLVRENMEVDVHVVSQEGQPNQTLLPERSAVVQFVGPPLQIWNAFCFILAVSFLSGLVDQFLGYRAIGFIYLLAVLAVGLLGSLGSVLFSAVLSAFAWNYFFIPPRFTFSILDPADAVLCISYLAVAFIVGYLTNRIRFHERIIREREDRTNVLFEVLKDISGSQNKEEFLLAVINRVGPILNAHCGIFLAGRDGRLQFDLSKGYAIRIDEKSQAVAAWSFQADKPAGWSTQTLAESKSLFIPLRSQANVLGVFVFTPRSDRRLNLDQETLLYSICNQIATSLERHFLEKRLQESKLLEDSERLHQTLLNSISHEIRTPLTTILASASALEQEGVASGSEVVKASASLLTDASNRLNRVVENLLDMSRLNSGVLGLKMEWHDVSDLIGVILLKNARTFASHQIKTEIQDGLPLVKVDFHLMEHALTNLVVNAVNYTPSGTRITISATAEAGILMVVVDDEGRGIPVEERSRIFTKFYRVPGTPAGGTGLGLSIVQSIVEAHGGRVSVESNSAGGARFTVALSIEAKAPTVPEESHG